MRLFKLKYKESFQAPVLDLLETRVLYSADPLSSSLAPLLDSLEDNQPQWTQLEASAAATDVVIVLSNVSNSVEMIDAILASSNPNDEVVVYHVDASRNSLASIEGILAGHSSLESIKIVSHGSDARIRIGDAYIDEANVDSYATTLNSWGHALSDRGDLLFYGCDVASSATGKTLIDKISQLSGADVAASTNLTGHSVYEGDWELEYATGGISRSAPLLNDAQAQTWNDLLAVINVSILTDVSDAPDLSSTAALLANPGGDGEISLREAIDAANADNSEDEIVLAADTYVLTNTTNGDLELKGEITITGQGSGATTLDASGLSDRVFGVATGVNTITGVTITGGDSPSDAGGAILVRGGTLNLIDVSVEGNQTASAIGGGISVESPATLNMTASQLLNNIAGDDDDPAFKDGGAIHSRGIVTLTQVLVEGNYGAKGGAIHNHGSMTISDSWFKGNTSSDEGGAIHNHGGTLDIESTTFEQNIASNSGGAIWSDGDLSVASTTFSGNITSNDGSAIYTSGSDNFIEHSTFTLNTSSGDGRALTVANDLDLKASIFVDNNGGVGRPTSGAINSLGFNLQKDSSVFGANETDIFGVDALIGSLQDNGGFAPTHALLNGSPAINAGPGQGGTDATGALRDILPDIGAFEYRTSDDVDKLFWTDSSDNAIYRANPDGTAVQKIIETDRKPFDVEVDWVGGRIYWVEADGEYTGSRGFGDLKSADLDGDNIAVLRTGLKFPTGIALNLDAGKIFVTSDESSDNTIGPTYKNEILRYDLNGTNEETVFSGFASDPQPNRLVSPVNVEYDAATQTLYWSDTGSTASSGTSEIKMADLSAGTAPVILHDVDGATGHRAYGFALVPGEEELYWASGAGYNVLDYSGAVPISSVGESFNDVYGIEFSETQNLFYFSTHNGEIRSSVVGSLSSSILIPMLADPSAIAVARVVAVSTPPLLERNTVLSVDEGAIASLSDSVLSVSDADSADVAIAYTVATAPSHGRLEDSIGSLLSEFTQADLLAGNVHYRHGGEEEFADSFTFTFGDGPNVSALQTFAIAITEVNDAPVASVDSGIVNEEGSVNIPLASNDSDFDGSIDLTSVAIAVSPTNGILTINTDGSVDYTHGGGENIADSFSYTIADDDGAASAAVSVSVTVIPQNDSPIAINDSVTLAEAGVVNFQVAVNDTDADDGINAASIAIVNGPTSGSVVVNTDGSLDYTHGGSETTSDTIEYTIEDNSGAVSARATVSITVTPVNDAPDAADDALTVNEGASVALDITENDSDVDGTVQGVVVSSQGVHGSVVANSDGTIQYAHNGAEFSTDSFTYSVLDNDGQVSNTATVNLTIAPVNDGPVATADSYTLAEGGALSLSVLSNDSDADDGIDASSVDIVTDTSHGSTSVTTSGEVVYTHGGGELASDNFTYTVADASGVVSAPVTVSLAITPVNDTPIAVSESLSVVEGGTTSIAVLSNDSDSDDGLDATSVSIVGLASAGSVAVNPDGTVQYTHSGSETSADSFSYTVKDNSGGESTAVLVTIAVTPVNDSPIATDDSYTVTEGAAITLPLTLNDTDSDSIIDASSVTIIAQTNNGSLSLNADGEFVYSHDGSETNSDSFTYGLTDSAGAVSEAATVLLDILPANDAPVAIDDTYSVEEGGAISMSLQDNDTDSDDIIDMTLLEIVDLPGHGRLTQDALGNVSYIHDGSETSSDSFTYRLIDSQGLNSEIATVSLTVLASNDAPRVTNDSASVEEGGVVNISILDNDSDSDNELSASSIELLTAAEFGLLEINTDGTARYAHDGSETTQDQFTYLINDELGKSSGIASVAIDIAPVNDVPQLVNELTEYTVADGQAVILPADTFIDVDSANLVLFATLASGEPLPEGILFNAETSTFLIEDTALIEFPLQILLVATDEQGESASLAFTLNTDVEPELGAASDESNPGLSANPIPAAAVFRLPEESTVASAASGPSDPTNSLPDIAQQAEELAAQQTIKIYKALSEVNWSLSFDSNNYFYANNAGTDTDQEDSVKRNIERQFNLTDLSTNTPRSLGALFGISEYERNPVMSSLQQYLDQEKPQSTVINIKVGTGVTATSVVSIGYVLWVIRGGVLLTSMLSALPAWRFLDPIPVLESFDGEDNDPEADGDESLSALVENQPGRRQRIKARLLNGRDALRIPTAE